MRTTVSLFIAGALGALLVAGTSAAIIVGTAGNDVLRGSSQADRIDGKGGNDKLFGLGGKDVLLGGAGSDVLTGGPGADRLSCGLGRDIAYADAADSVISGCEVVKGLPRPSPPPPVAPPPPPQPPPPPPPPPAVAGSYVGLSSQNERVTFDVVAGGTALTNFRINSVNQSCQPPNLVSIFGPLNLGTNVIPIAANGSWTWTFVGPGSVSGIPAQFNIAVGGQFTGTGAAGAAKFDLSFTASGINIACTSGTVTWTAARA